MALALTTTGLTIQSLEEIETEIKSNLWNTFSTSLALTSLSLFGQIVSVIAERLALCHELLQAIYNSQDPDAGTGTSLEALCALTGTTRLAARPSTAFVTLTGTAGTVVTAGSRAGNGVGVEWSLDDPAAALAAVTAWASSTAYTVGQYRTNASRVYVCRTAGTSAGSGGPTTTSSDITDGTAHWRYLGDGTAATHNVPVTATVDGPNQSVAGTIVEIVTPISGWSGVYNQTDATLGADEETDEDLRTRRELELSQPGTSPPDALRADLLEVDGVTNVIVFYNPQDTTDADGMPPHSVEALVQGGADQDITDAIGAGVAAGIQTHGTNTFTWTDDNGTDHDIKWSRPTEVLIYVDITLLKDPAFYPLDGDDQVKAAIVAYGDSLPVGRNVVASAVASAAFRVAGVLDVTATLIDDAPAPATSTTVVIGTRELALYDTSRVAVHSSNGTP